MWIHYLSNEDGQDRLLDLEGGAYIYLREVMIEEEDGSETEGFEVRYAPDVDLMDNEKSPDVGTVLWVENKENVRMFIASLSEELEAVTSPVFYQQQQKKVVKRGK